MAMCQYSNAADGTTCDAGWSCRGGACLNAFQYTPANFDPTTITAIAPVANFNCGTTTYNSGTNAWTNWCGQAGDKPTPVTLTPGNGAPTAVVLPVFGLNVADAGTLLITGTSSVIFAVYGDAVVGGRVSIDADHETAGAGGSPGSCLLSNGGNGQGAAATTTNGGGGGAGAGFGTGGSNGGFGDGHTNFGAGSGGFGGLQGGNATLVPLRGGCTGGTGGNASSSSAGTGGVGGAGGGALQISAAGVLTVAGVVSASGGGGRLGGARRAGGGGAGSGGGLIFQGDSVAVAASARVSANGGGGGEGARDGSADNQDGQNGNGPTPNMTAAGGNMSPNGGNGGNGGFQGTNPTQGQDINSNNSGGGGGGGAVGRIRIDARTTCTVSGGNIVSPGSHGTGTGCPP
jgi:hypothetical protein